MDGHAEIWFHNRIRAFLEWLGRRTRQPDAYRVRLGYFVDSSKSNQLIRRTLQPRQRRDKSCSIQPLRDRAIIASPGCFDAKI